MREGKTCFLSIIIPVYNTEQYLADCLDSCLNQNIAAEDYEIICVNDGSSDNSEAVLRMYAEKHPRIRVISQQNAGVSTARNTGLEAAKGEYIWFVDSDDVIMTNCLRELMDKCLETDCDRLGFYLVSVPQDIPNQEQLIEIANNDSTEKYTYESGYMVITLMRRNFLLSHNIRFQPSIAYGEDMVFNYTWDLHSYKFERLNKVLYFYRSNPASAIQTLEKSRKAQVKRFRSIMQILIWLRENGMRYNGTGSFIPELALRYSDMLHMLILGLLPDMTRKDAMELWRELKEYRLLAKEYLYCKKEDGQVVIAPQELRNIYCRYVFNRARFCIRHPIQWFFI